MVVSEAKFDAEADLNIGFYVDVQKTSQS